MQRFFLKLENFTETTVNLFDPEIIHQMSRVLRMRIGEKFIALDNTGNEYICVLAELNDKKATAEIAEKRLNQAEPALLVTLYQAPPKKMDLFEMVLQKGTEIGISRFVPLITERTERREITNKPRLEKILREAAEQCERGKIPELSKPVLFEDVKINDFGILLHGRGDYSLLGSKLAEIKKAGNCSIFIGPEGGFSQQEVEAARNKGFHICSLGPRILRTETAAITAASLILTC